MISIERERAGGKTYRLVQEMLKPGNEDMVYVAPTMHQAREIAARTASEMGAEVTPELLKRFTSVGYIRQFQGQRVRLVIDEADGVLSQLLGAPVAFIAYTPRVVSNDD